MDGERPWFLEPREPREFFEKAMKLNHELGGDRFFNGQSGKWLREACTIGRFGEIIEADAVWLKLVDPPDAAIKINGRVYEIEITEALKPGRKRGDEYRNTSNEIEEASQDDLWLDQNDYAIWIRNTAEQKIAKYKLKNINFPILVDVSGGDWFSRIDAMKLVYTATINEISQKHGFDICILHKGCAFGPLHIVPNGFAIRQPLEED